MNEVSLRLTVALELVHAKYSPEDYKETCEWLVKWVQEGQEVDDKALEGTSTVTHLTPVN